MARSGGLTQLVVIKVVNMAVSLEYHLISVMEMYLVSNMGLPVMPSRWSELSRLIEAMNGSWLIERTCRKRGAVKKPPRVALFLNACHSTR